LKKCSPTAVTKMKKNSLLIILLCLSKIFHMVVLWHLRNI
jgi:hypothetical protein